MTRLVTSLVAAALTFVLIPQSQAWALGVTAVGGLESASITASLPSTAAAGATLPTYSRKLQPTFGGFVDYGVFPFVSLEAGALYLPRKVESLSGTTLTTLGETRLQVPLLLRVSVPFVSVGGGVYYAYGLGNVQTEVGGATTETTYDAGNVNRNESGLMGSARVSFPLFPLLSALVDVRYCHALSNRDSTGSTQSYSRDIQVLAGVHVGF